ncbi:hypothetical protein BDQ17DRAFT_1394002 [Cyathus striatus]|nr:hypothetical protein BDQ17DRAFT_1394002 [Cyathus striatus]
MAFSTWIAVFILLIEVFQYSDDSFGVQRASDVQLYLPYQWLLPTNQAKLLSLWDDLGIPHESEKQLHGTRLTIIGFLVNADSLTITMPPGKKQELIKQIESFCAPGAIKQTLCDFQHLAGWINWALNVFPLLRPGLCAVYQETTGSEETNDHIYVTNNVCENLFWLVHHLHIERELLILEDITWDPNTVDTTLYVDASLKGLGIWDLLLHVGYHFIFPPNILGHDIFIYEVLAVISALHLVPNRVLSTHTLIIFLDTLTRAFNHLLKLAVDALLWEDYQLCVLHIPGDENHVADALSHQHFDCAFLHDPKLSLHSFQPPQDVLGVLIK